MNLEKIVLHPPRLVNGQWASAAEFCVDGQCGRLMLSADEPLVRQLYSLAERAVPRLQGRDWPMVGGYGSEGGAAAGTAAGSAVAGPFGGLAGASMGGAWGEAAEYVFGGGYHSETPGYQNEQGQWGMSLDGSAPPPDPAADQGLKIVGHLPHATAETARAVGTAVFSAADKLPSSPTFQAILLAATGLPPGKTPPTAEEAIAALIQGAARGDSDAILKMAEVAIGASIGHPTSSALAKVLNGAIAKGTQFAAAKADWLGFLKGL